MGQITRQTLFRLPNAEDQDVAIAAYHSMFGTNKKDGKEYLISGKVYKLHSDPRSGGFTVLAQTVFASLDDMKYYDDHDEAHTVLKKAVGPKVDGGKAGVMTLYMDS